MRAQLNARNDDLQQRATHGYLANAVANAITGTSNNSNGVPMLGQGADGRHNQSQMQAVIDKLDELINALRR